MLKLTVASATVLALTGGAIALIRPGIDAGRFTDAARGVLLAAGRAVLDGSLQAAPNRESAGLGDLPRRIEVLVTQLPPHAQDEISQLMALLSSAIGRTTFAGLATPWEDASTADIQVCLQGMRTSRLALRRQAYQALHDLIGAAYFSDADTWPMLGYPGPAVALS